MTQDSPDRAGILLRTASQLLAPLARLLVAHGVTYTMFAQAMKRVFLAAAEQELAAEGKRITDSALSLLSGVHRKDVRTLTSDAPRPRRALTLASQVAMAWATQPEYLDANGNPLALPMRSNAPGVPSFEQLSQSISKDFHARSMLDELVRLGVAEETDGLSRLVQAEGAPPVGDIDELAQQLAANVGDHLAAAAANFTTVQKGGKPPHLEYALWADELSAETVAELQRLAQRHWVDALKSVRNVAETRSAHDRVTQPPESLRRLRFGVYVYDAPGYEPLAGAPGGPEAPGGSEASAPPAHAKGDGSS